MKLTQSKLRQIIEEEIQNLKLNEFGGWGPLMSGWWRVRDELKKMLGPKWTPEDEKLFEKAVASGDSIENGLNWPVFKAQAWYPLFVKIVNKVQDEDFELETGFPPLRKQPQKFKQTRLVPKKGR